MTPVDGATPTSNYAALLTQFPIKEEVHPNSISMGYLGPRGAQQNDTTTAAAAVQFLQANINWQSRLIFNSTKRQCCSALRYYSTRYFKTIRSKADVHAVLNQAERSGQITHSERHRLEGAFEAMLVHPDVHLLLTQPRGVDRTRNTSSGANKCGLTVLLQLLRGYCSLILKRDNPRSTSATNPEIC